MDYFNNVLTTFLGLEHVSCVAVYSLKKLILKPVCQNNRLWKCPTLWCNSVAKHRLRRRRSTPASTSLPVQPRPPIRAHSVNNERGKRRSVQKQNDKDAPKTTGCCAVQVVEKQSLHYIPSDPKSGWTLFVMKFQTTSVRARSFVHFILLQIRLQTKQGIIRHGIFRNIAFTFTFMHLADAFIQSDLHCIQVTVLHLISSCFPWESNPWSWRC